VRLPFEDTGGRTGLGGNFGWVYRAEVLPERGAEITIVPADTPAGPGPASIRRARVTAVFDANLRLITAVLVD